MNNIEQLQRLMIDGGQRAFDLVPLALKNVIDEKQWVGRKNKDGNEFQSFEEFVTHMRWQGLESSIDELLVYCRRHPEVTATIKQEIGALAEHGGDRTEQGDNVTLGRGNNPTYALKRLKRDRPDLAEKVVAGELSSHAAAILAGFRKKWTPFEIVKKNIVKLTEDEWLQVVDIRKSLS